METIACLNSYAYTIHVVLLVVHVFTMRRIIPIQYIVYCYNIQYSLKFHWTKMIYINILFVYIFNVLLVIHLFTELGKQVLP